MECGLENCRWKYTKRNAFEVCVDMSGNIKNAISFKECNVNIAQIAEEIGCRVTSCIGKLALFPLSDVYNEYHVYTRNVSISKVNKNNFNHKKITKET